MSILHTINRSPLQQNDLQACLARIQDDAAILLYEDGVYAALEKIANRPDIKLSEVKGMVYLLQSDFDARGLSPEDMLAGIECVDYEGFVKLCTEFSVVQAWS